MTRQKTIMIIDDDPNFLQQFDEMLKLSGYSTEIYPNGVEALQAMRDHHPDLIVTDLRMDEMSGFEVIKNLRQRPSTARIPVIVMSAFYGKHQFQELTRTYGVRRCLAKPVKPLDVISQIEDIFNNSQ